jgi:hypothetical protein
MKCPWWTSSDGFAVSIIHDETAAPEPPIGSDAHRHFGPGNGFTEVMTGERVAVDADPALSPYRVV